MNFSWVDRIYPAPYFLMSINFYLVHNRFIFVVLFILIYILGHILRNEVQKWTKKDNCWFNVILVTFIKTNIKDENFISIYLLDRKEGGYMLLYIVCVTWHHFTQVVNGTSQGFPFQWKIFHHCVKGIWIIRSVLVSFYFAKELK